MTNDMTDAELLFMTDPFMHNAEALVEAVEAHLTNPCQETEDAYTKAWYVMCQGHVQSCADHSVQGMRWMSSEILSRATSKEN